MNIVRKIVVGIAGMFVVALVLELAAPKAVHALVSTLVTVANTSSNPVPTMAVDTRNVNVINTPNVAATINGTPTVNIGSMPAVAIGGTVNATVANPLDGGGNAIPLVVQNPASGGNAFFVHASCALGGPSCGAPMLSVPANKIAVVESLSGACLVNTGSSIVSLTVFGEAGPGAQLTFVPAPPVSNTSTSDFQSFGQDLKGYFFGGAFGQNIGVTAFTNASQNFGNNCSFNLAGYFVAQ